MMENIPPIPHSELTQGDHTVCGTASPGSSLRSQRLLQQPTLSDCSAGQNSIGSSNFNVRQISRPEKVLSTDVGQPQANSSTSDYSRLMNRGHGAWDIADPPTKLTPRKNWVPAKAVFDAYHAQADPNDSPVAETTNNNRFSDVTEIDKLNDDDERTEESLPHMASDDAASSVVNMGSSELSRSTMSPRVSNSTAPSYGGIPEIQPPDEEMYRLRQIEDPRGTNWELFDLPKTSRARIYQYYICRIRKLRVLCDQGKNMTDLPVRSEEDFALLRTLTRTNWGSRWWTIMIDDLICPECVSLLKARRRDAKSKFQRTWLKIKSRIKRVCLCGDNNHDFVCHHTRTDMNKVTRFFDALGEENASRMVNIELDTDPQFDVDIDVLASAVHNAARYFKDVQRISIKFHFRETGSIERERIQGIICSLVKLEEMLPWGHKLHVAGFENHYECQRAWSKKSRARKWWMR